LVKRRSEAVLTRDWDRWQCRCTIRPKTMASGTRERTHDSRKLRGGGVLLRRASACARKGGKRWGCRWFVLDRVEREQGKGVPAWCAMWRGRGERSGGAVHARAGSLIASSGQARRQWVPVGEAGDRWGVLNGGERGAHGPAIGPIVLGWPDEREPL
jgi:hypothetical protein